MKKLLIALCLTLAAGSAYAKDEKAPTPQQEKMKSCNKDASDKGLKGADRRAFMKDCLGHKPAAAEPKKDLTPQQQKMQDCNKQAKDKGVSGPDRRKFMSECLKGDAKPADKK